MAVEKLVRGEGTSTNALADTASDLIMEAQDAAFSGEELPEAVLGDDTEENDVDADGDMTADQPNGDGADVSEGDVPEEESVPVTDDEEPIPDPDAMDAGSPESGSATNPEEAVESTVSGDNDEPDSSERSGGDTNDSGAGTATGQTSLADLTTADGESDSA